MVKKRDGKASAGLKGEKKRKLEKVDEVDVEAQREQGKASRPKFAKFPLLLIHTVSSKGQ